jgi:phenylalanyl-tRNA synthetase beta chain
MPMIVNTSWLLEYLEPQCSHEDLLDALPRVGLEIEHEQQLKRSLESVRIGFVREKESLTGASGLHLCKIEIEPGRVIPVVCASEHEVRVGWGVPVAQADTKLPTGRSIRAEHIHGASSHGMICLDGEMGLIARGSGMHYFTDEATLGAPLPSVSDIPEYLLELNALPNRPDFLGLIGIAREVAALLRLKLRYPASLTPAAAAGRAAPVPVEIKDAALCSRYMGGVVHGVKVAPSPPWLKARLLLAGMRPINNVVDITNYVLYEWGQPLHAFDLANLAGPKIVVRRMEPGETLELLTGKLVRAEGQEGGITFAEPPLVIADAERPVGIAGIMGGRSSQTTEQTTDLLVEAAHFDAINIRRTVKKVDLGIDSRGTASSYRFERGTDPNLGVEGGLGRALQLIAELAGGTVAGPLIDVHPAPRAKREFRLSPQRTSAYLGIPVEPATIRDCLERLSMDVADAPEGLMVRVPTWRVDVNDPVVLIEDVARMVGYDRIPVAPQPSLPTLGLRTTADRLRQAVSAHLVSAGFYESRNPSLESPKLSAWLGEPADAVSVKNWATQEMSVLRRSLIPGLAVTVQNNLRRGATAVRFFEVDRAFEPPRDSGPAVGRWRLAGIAGGRLHRSNWRADSAQVDFYTLKGVVEDLLDVLGIRNATFRPADREPFVAGSTAEIVLGDSRSAGYVGELDTTLVEIDRLPFRVHGFDLDLDALEDAFSTLAAYHPIPRQPAVTRDIAVVVKLTERFSELEATIRQAAGPTLEHLRLFDQYQGPQVAAGHQSLAFYLVFRHPDRTLTAEQVSETMADVVKALKERFGAELRA